MSRCNGNQNDLMSNSHAGNFLSSKRCRRWRSGFFIGKKKGVCIMLNNSHIRITRCKNLSSHALHCYPQYCSAIKLGKSLKNLVKLMHGEFPAIAWNHHSADARSLSNILTQIKSTMPNFKLIKCS